MNFPASGSAAVIAAQIRAVKSFGTIVTVEPPVFLDLVAKQERPIVVYSEPRIFYPGYRYLTTYKGLTFHSNSPTSLNLPIEAEQIMARKVMVP